MDNQTPGKEVKKEPTPDQILERHIEAMADHSMVRRLRRITRGSKKNPTSNIDATWAIVLSCVFENTKPVGKMEPFLR